MVRLEALATWTRMAGRATLTVEEAMDEARREARTRVEAIATDGGEWDDKEEKLLMDGKDWSMCLVTESWTSCAWCGRVKK